MKLVGAGEGMTKERVSKWTPEQSRRGQAVMVCSGALRSQLQGTYGVLQTNWTGTGGLASDF
jgi:hypothetical protein